jgi:hypothetical protein
MKKFDPLTYKRYPNEPMMRPYRSLGNILISDPIKREIADIRDRQQIADLPFQSAYYSEHQRKLDNERLYNLEKQTYDRELLEIQQKELEFKKQHLEKIMSKQIEPTTLNMQNTLNINGDNNAPVAVGNVGETSQEENFLMKIFKWAKSILTSWFN